MTISGILLLYILLTEISQQQVNPDTMKIQTGFTAASILITMSCLICGCKKSNDGTNKLPVCTITHPQNGDEISKGDTVVINADATDPDGKIAEVRFYIDDNGTGFADQFPYTFTWLTGTLQTGTHKIRISATDNDGGSSSDEIAVFLTAPVPVDQPPVVDFSADKTSITRYDSIHFTDLSTNNPTTWAWNFGDGETSSLQNPTHTFTKSGTFTVSLTAANNFGYNTLTKTGLIAVAAGDTTGIVTDIDGNVYKTIKIGTQWWMAENLKTTHYNDGSPITQITNLNDWKTNTGPAFAWFYYDRVAYKDRFGALYNWNAVNTGKLSPEGWHVPTEDEWTNLINYLIENGYNFDGTTTGNKIAKAMADTSSWTLFNVTGGNPDNTDYPAYRNKSGFTAVSTGYCDTEGGMGDPGYNTYWWTATEYNNDQAWYHGILGYQVDIPTYAGQKNFGFFIRCVRN